MVVSNVTYLVNWKTAAMPHHLAAAVWCCVAEKTHLRASWPTTRGKSPDRKKSSRGHAPLPRLCVAGWPVCLCTSLSGDDSEKSRTSKSQSWNKSSSKARSGHSWHLRLSPRTSEAGDHRRTSGEQPEG